MSSTTRFRTNAIRAGIVLIAATSLFACSKSDSDGSTTTKPAPTTTAAPAAPTTTITEASSGKPSFTAFEVSKSVPCESGNATATMSFSTTGVDSIAISIGGGEFASTAGYGPNESAVVASIPCSGAGSSTIQLQGCSGTDVCTESDVAKVTITA